MSIRIFLYNKNMENTPHYRTLLPAARALLKGETDPIANAANLAALLFNTLPGLNWAGFYRWKDGQLVLGPFQGKPACVRILPGKEMFEAAQDNLQKHSFAPAAHNEENDYLLTTHLYCGKCFVWT